MSAREDWVEQARAEGLAPAEAGAPERPWPVVVLTALGAWLAVPPFIFLLAMIFGRDWDHGPMAYIEGIGLLTLAVVLLRSRALPLFVEQAAIPLLLTGGVCLGYGLARDLSNDGAALTGLVIGAALIALLPQGWLRMLLGAGMAGLVAFLIHLALRDLTPHAWYRFDGGQPLTQAALLLAFGLAMAGLQARAGRNAATAPIAAAMEPALAGWWIVVLACHALAAGWSFGAVGAFGPTANVSRDLWAGMPAGHAVLHTASRGLSVALVLIAAVWLQHRWRLAGAARMLPPVLVLAALAALMPALGGTLLVLSLMLSTRRWRLATLAGAAAVWAIGALYYEWHLPLAHKSLALVAAGAALLAWVRWLAWHPAPAPGTASPATFALRGAPAVLTGAGVLALAVVNVGIAGRERLIDTGRPVFVKLAPVDPRSLMQGDYMRLSYDLPGVDWSSRHRVEAPMLWGARPRIAVTLDARGVAQSPRLLGPDEAAPPGTQLLQLTPKGGGWTFVSDGWFFKEGEAQRWQAARYGEFRVTPEGKGLLVRVVGEDLKPL
jgi:uncharacterized membrane-anchored protein